MRLFAKTAYAIAFGLAAVQVVPAADIPVRAPAYKTPVVAPVFSWTSCYIGGHVGGGWAHKDWSEPPYGGTSHTADGVIAGGQVGCDYQAGVWVFGGEGQFSWADLKGDSVIPFFPTQANRSKIDFLGTVAGRLGYAMDRTLLYVKGGGAWVNERFDITDSNFGGAVRYEAGHQTRWGWTVGAGVEYAFAPNWSAKVEYNFMGFGSDSRTFHDVLGTGVAPFAINIDQQIHTVNVGLNWRFWGGRGY